MLSLAGAIGGAVAIAQTQGGRGAQAPPPPVPAPGRAGGGAGIGAGPYDLPAVDAAAADRGRSSYAAQCITCHGTQARGGEGGVNLVRSEVVLKDRGGNLLLAFLRKGHPMQSGASSATITEAQGHELSHFLRQRVNDGLRGSPIFVPGNVLTGDAKAGQAYFNGEGRCTQCHQPTGDLAGIGARLDPVALQQRFVFPGTGRASGRGRVGGAPAQNRTAITVVVTPAQGPAVAGVLLQMDDFVVTLRDASNTVRTIRRGPGVTVAKTVPLQFHIELLDRLTDRQMHDVVAFLETLK